MGTIVGSVILVILCAVLNSFTPVGIPAMAQKQRVTISVMPEDQEDPQSWKCITPISATGAKSKTS
ncbi:MAG TPA: hypothetical protein VFD60_00355 [Nitrososphaeraceae archaeon]|nr:hypothetical protein [Nitrososphaeraceae archaeon]